ncbi:hypothetical protein ACVWYO_003807 [Sphingomonas sp. UYP23]
MSLSAALLSLASHFPDMSTLTPQFAVTRRNPQVFTVPPGTPKTPCSPLNVHLDLQLPLGTLAALQGSHQLPSGDEQGPLVLIGEIKEEMM